MVTPRLPRAARRAQLIEVAAGAFLERGFEATSMEDVAQAAGVSRLIVYRIFESKENLYRAVLRNVLIALGEQFAGIDLETIRLTGATHIVLPVARAQPDAFRLLARHALARAGVRRRGPGVPRLRARLRQGHPRHLPHRRH